MKNWLRNIVRRFHTSWSHHTARTCVILLALTGAAVWWRDSGLVLESSRRVGHWLAGNDRPWSVVDVFLNVLILAFFLGSIAKMIAWTRYAYRQSHSDQVQTSHFLADTPAKPEKDELGRLAFAREVTSTISRSPKDSSVVIAIEGSWGEGKTSVLEWVSSELALQEPTPIIVRFDPWPEDSKQGVVSRLLDAISEAIGGRSDLSPSVRSDSARVLTRLATAAARAVPEPYSLAARLVSSIVGTKYPDARPDSVSSLPEDRAQLRRCLTALPVRLIVIVDDLDRVDESELRAILLAVNALSSFPNTNVVLAFDPEVVDAVLGSAGLVSNGGVPFREKVVHVSMPLPLPRYYERRSLFDRGLEEILSTRNLSSDWMSWPAARREEAATMAVQIAKSPRTIKRVINHFGMVCARLQKEVDGVDVLLLELLRAAIPPVWGFIRTHRVEFDRKYSTLDAVPTLPVRKPQRVGGPISSGDSLLDLAIKSAPLPAQGDARRILRAIFPDLEDESPQLNHDDSIKNARVSAGIHLKRYFSYGVDGDEVSISDVRAFLKDASKRGELVEAAQRRGVVAQLMTNADTHLKGGGDVVDVLPLMRLTIRTSASEWKNKRNDITEECADLLYRSLSVLSENDRLPAAEEIAKNTISVSTSHRLILDLLSHAQLWREGVFTINRQPEGRYYERQLLRSPNLIHVKDLWIQTVWNIGLPHIFANEPRPMEIVYRLAQLEGDGAVGYNTVKHALDMFLKDDDGLLALVSQYSQSTHLLSHGVNGLERLISDWDKFSERVSLLKEPQDAIEKIKEYSEDLASSQRHDS
jgi:hypothetical protein